MTYLGQQRYRFPQPILKYVQRSLCLAALLLGAAVSDVALGIVAVGDPAVGNSTMVDNSAIDSPAADSPAADSPAIDSVEAEPVPEQPNHTPINPSADVPHRFPEGPHLFGQASEPGKIGVVYTVFAVQGDRITGAFYMPQSSFDCFQGRVTGDRLSVTVRDSYEQTTSPYSIALVQAESPIASSNIAAPQTGLDGFDRIASLSANDQRVLDVCRAETW